MEWNYRNVVITVEENGKFCFSINGKTEKVDSLEIAKSQIDIYTFSKMDMDNLCNILTKREGEFVRALITELKRHNFSTNLKEIDIDVTQCITGSRGVQGR